MIYTLWYWTATLTLTAAFLGVILRRLSPNGFFSLMVVGFGLFLAEDLSCRNRVAMVDAIGVALSLVLWAALARKSRKEARS